MLLGDLITLGRNLVNHSILPMLLGRQACTSDMITLGKNLIYHSILINALSQTYLYMFFDHTWQELKVSLRSDQWS
jgi:hypothetical protein